MFEGYGVGLTVSPLVPVRGPQRVAPGVVDRPSRLAEVFPAGSRSREANALELTRMPGLKAALAAYEAHLVMELAAQSGAPEAGDARPGSSADGTAEGPIPGTSEFFVDELAVILNCTSRSAARLAGDAHVLTQRMPAVWAALADGHLDRPRAQVFVDVLGPTADGVAEVVAPRVLPGAAGLSLGRLRSRLAKEALGEDEQAADGRRAQAEEAADVRVFPVADGMSELATDMPAPVAAACFSTIDQLAWLLKQDGDSRPIGQLRSMVHADLILRPWDNSRPAVTATLTVVAPLSSVSSGSGAGPAEVNGQPITAAHVRDLLAHLDAVCPGGLRAPTGGSLQIAVTDADGTLLATSGRPELERLARRGCLEHPGDGCECPVLSAPAPVDRYVPSPAQRRFVTTRDRTCRHPNCGQPVGRVDLDHVDAYAEGGPTDCRNLCCLCRHHHRLKTHAPGWRFVLTDDGLLRVTTPSGITRTTGPPGRCERSEQRDLPAPPPAVPEPAPF